MHRAYSLLTVKSVDVEHRILTGIATTPEPDRVGDVIESLGVKFANPLPLLLFHDHTNPVGTATFDRPTKAGISFTAHLPEITEPGQLKDAIDKAWQLVKLRLVKGVSIGFRVLNDSIDLMKSGGIRFRETEVLELSLVTVPANAAATIHTIKSLDVGMVASDHEPPVEPLIPSGVSDKTRVVHAIRKDARPMAKTISEQISAFEATRQAKSARRHEIMTKAGDEGVTLDTAQTEEYDTLDVEVKSIDAHLTRLAALEKENKAAALPVNGDDPDKASASRGGSVISVKQTLPPGIEFTRYAMCLAAANGNRGEALEIAKARFPDSARIQFVLKAAVAAGTTTDATWAGPLVQYQDFMGDFIEFLRPQTIVGKFGTGGIPSLRRVPFNIRIKKSTAGMTGYWVGQGAPKPVTKGAFDTVTMLWAKVAAISVITEELARFSSPAAEELVRDELAAALIAKIDTDFIDPSKAAVANVSPASITNGITPINATAATAAGLRTDVQALFSPFIAANITPSTGVWIMSATRALAISLMMNALGQPEFPSITMMGGTFLGLPVIVSEYVTTGSSPNTDLMILVNASDIYLADDGQVVIDVSREASLEMLDNPTNNSATPTATSVVSLWQTNSIGLRAERFINWARRRDSSVQYIQNAAYGA